MVAYLVFTVLPIVLFTVRFIRMVQFYRAWKTNPDAEEERAARANFFIHLGICILLFLLISGLGYLLRDTINF